MKDILPNEVTPQCDCGHPDCTAAHAIANRILGLIRSEIAPPHLRVAIGIIVLSALTVEVRATPDTVINEFVDYTRHILKARIKLRTLLAIKKAVKFVTSHDESAEPC